MKEYEIILFSEAENDLNTIVEYLATLSEQTALKYFDLIVETIGTLRSMPERRALLTDPRLRLRGYSMIRVNDYVVFFLINDDKVEIHRILHAKRSYIALL